HQDHAGGILSPNSPCPASCDSPARISGAAPPTDPPPAPAFQAFGASSSPDPPTGSADSREPASPARPLRSAETADPFANTNPPLPKAPDRRRCRADIARPVL